MGLVQKKGMKERLEGREEGRGERDVGKDEGGRVGERGGRGGWRGWEGGKRGGREASKDGGCSARDSPQWLGGSFSPPPLSRRFLAAGGVITEGLERRRQGRGQQLLQPPLAEVRCLLLRLPVRVSASLGAGSEAAPRSPRPPRVQPKRERQRPGSPLGEAVSAQARPLARSLARSLARPRGPHYSAGLSEAQGGVALARTAWGAPSGRGGAGAELGRPGRPCPQVGGGDGKEGGTAEGRRCRVHDNRVTLRAGIRS